MGGRGYGWVGAATGGRANNNETRAVSKVAPCARVCVCVCVWRTVGVMKPQVLNRPCLTSSSSAVLVSRVWRSVISHPCHKPRPGSPCEFVAEHVDRRHGYASGRHVRADASTTATGLPSRWPFFSPRCSPRVCCYRIRPLDGGLREGAGRRSGVEQDRPRRERRVGAGAGGFSEIDSVDSTHCREIQESAFLRGRKSGRCGPDAAARRGSSFSRSGGHRSSHCWEGIQAAHDPRAVVRVV